MEVENNDSYINLDWFIENFTFYTEEVHGPYINKDRYLQLYPKDLYDGKEQLTVLVDNSYRPSYLKLSIIGSDGSILFSREDNDPVWTTEDKYTYTIKLFSGVKFEDVVTKTRMHRDLFKDILTIRLRMKHSEPFYNSTYTVLSMAVVCLKIYPDILRSISYGYHTHIATIKGIFGFRVSKHDLFASLDSADLENAEIRFKLAPMVDEAPIPHAIRTCISRLSSDGTVLKTDQNAHVLGTTEKWVFSDMLNRKEIVDGSQLLLLRFVIINGSIEEDFSINAYEELFSTEVKNTSTCRSLLALSEDLKLLYEEHTFSDCQVICGESFPTHESIISSRSPVLKSLLNNTEDRKLRLLDSMDARTLDLVLRFLYTARIDMQWEDSLKVYYEADRYEIDSLKETCMELFADRVSTSNVYELLSLSDVLGDESLESFAHDFVLKNFDAVLNSEDWNRQMETNPKLLLKLLTSLAVKGLIGRRRFVLPEE